MSGLAKILAHHHDPGVYRWHAAFPADEVAHAVEHAGWRFGYVDGWHHQTRHEFLAAVGEALDVPRALRAEPRRAQRLPARPARPHGAAVGRLVHARPRGRDRLQRRPARSSADHTASLTTLLRGDGPDVDVPVARLTARPTCRRSRRLAGDACASTPKSAAVEATESAG